MNSRLRLSIEPRSLLACIPLFAGLQPERLDRLGGSCRVLELPSHRAVYSAGQSIREAHFLVSGSVKRFALLADNVEKILDIVQTGQMLALSEIFTASHYASFAETVERSVIVAVSVERLREVVAVDASLAGRLLQAIAHNHYAAEFEVVRHRSLSVTRRVLDYLLSQAGERRGLAGETTVCLGASKRLIAARLDMAPETFSRTLRQLSSDGVIVVEGRKVHIQNATLAAEERIARESAQPLVRYPRLERSPPDGPSPTALVNHCGRHRMLSQRMASAWGMIARGIQVQPARVALRRYRDQFQRNLALVASQEFSAVLRQPLAELADAWGAFDELLVAQPPDVAAAPEIFRLSEEVLDRADALTAMAASQIGSESARMVNIAGRNRMLCARVVKLVVFADLGIDEVAAARRIAEARAEFESNMVALRRHGAGSPEAEAQLRIDGDHWARFVEVIDDKGQHGETRVKAVIAAGDELLRNVDTTVKLYERLFAGPRKVPATRPTA